jgi:signal transduction histidine kinase
MLVMIVLAAGVGWFMARKAMSGVEDVTQAALNISRGDFSRRVPLKSRGYEIEKLATTFNHMIDRIQSLLKGIHEVTDNIAHDLRSPLASIRGTTELTIINADSIDEYQEMARNTIEECDRLIATINAMLDISEAEAGAARLDLQPVNVCRLVQQACDLYLPIAEEKEQTLAFQGPIDCHIDGDLKMIQRLVSNLLDNALKYTPNGGMVNISIQCLDDHLVLIVEDNGIGIDERDLPFIFKRFFRCDQSRGQEGSGLGLSMAAAIVKAHGGIIDVLSHPGTGSRFTVRLPSKAESLGQDGTAVLRGES